MRQKGPLIVVLSATLGLIREESGMWLETGMVQHIVDLILAGNDVHGLWLASMRELSPWNGFLPSGLRLFCTEGLSQASAKSLYRRPIGLMCRLPADR